MDERSFVDSKRDSWDRLERNLDRVRRSGLRSLSAGEVETLGAAYRAVVSDLAFARSQGASESLVSHLNDLAGRAHGVVYASEGARLAGAAAFLTRDFPTLVRSTFRYTLVAALVFAIGWAAAAYLVYSDTATAVALLPGKVSGNRGGDGRIQVPDPAAMSSYIMTNNVKVGIIAFAAGTTAGVLTTAVLLYNGFAIGLIATAEAPAMGAARFWSLILPHGIIELVAIFICGGAGLMVGSAMIAPGNLRRADATRIAAGKALRLFAGALPMFVVAAIIEGFITPSVIPSWSKLSFAALTAIALALYLGFAGGRHKRVPSPSQGEG